MAMLITKFNKLIANKFIWIGFTFLVVVAFAFMGLTGADDARDPAARHAVGTLFGEPVSPEAFRNAYIHSLMAVTLSYGRHIPMTEEINKELTDLAWKRLVSLKQAQRMHIRVSDREVVEAIRSFPDFQEQNRFNPDLYRAFVHHYLGQLGFGPNQFEEHVRQELALQKLRRMVAESVLITPPEIQRAVHSFGDEFTVQYVLIDEEVLGEGLEITEEEALAFFEENSEAFTIPPKVRVKYVRFPIDRYKDDVEVTEEQALDYYDLNIDQFTHYEEDEDADRDQLFDDEELFQVATTKPFEDVKDEIMDQLRRDMAARRAADVAMDFVIKLVPDRQGDAATFEEAAEAYDLAIEQTEPFARNEVPENIDAGIAFSVAAFHLRPHPEYYFSDAVEGAAHIYVLALEERLTSYVPEFEEVADQVREAAQRDAVVRAVEELANTFQETATAELREGKTFSDIAKMFAIPFSEPVTFTAAAGLEGLEYGSDILRAVLAYNEGEVTAPVYTGAGYLVAHVAERAAADVAQFGDFRQQIVNTLARERTHILFEEWQEYMLKKADFTPRELEPRPSADDDDFDDDWV